MEIEGFDTPLCMPHHPLGKQQDSALEIHILNRFVLGFLKTRFSKKVRRKD